ncbi:hypothetical protein [Streptomyces caniscabiei]|uniref:hypothetical protein n=1 Tax=Streptomyces caniscabiei TaxID=2746961 RepID=UPI00187325B6|nr:hypothetical protein [Streptomyces caniscabiei]MBE4771235.1 hypothetical protein [Streptomyces caniscabiei]MDX2952030.1 hypothetical protein [Streptomyces caniscabiei]
MGFEREGAKDYLYYASGWIWPHNYSGQIKSLLLFFDGVTLSLPAWRFPDVIDRSVDLGQSLFEKGLLINLPPEESLTPTSSSRLAEGLTQWIRNHPHRDTMPFDREESLWDTSSEHWGERDDQQIAAAGQFVRELQNLGLAHMIDSRWCLSPDVYFLVLMAYCRSLQEEIAHRSDIVLQPVVDINTSRFAYSRQFLEDLRGQPSSTTARDPQRTAARVIESDWHEVGVDLSLVPLDEVLDFRAEHGESFRSYAQGLRNLLLASEKLNDEQFEAELSVRSAQISEEAANLQKMTRRAFGQSVAAAVLALGGATWTATQGDPIGALFATASAGVAFARPSRPVTAYSYFFEIDRRFG